MNFREIVYEENLHFEASPLAYLANFFLRQGSEFTLQEAANKNISLWFFLWLKWKVEKNLNIIISIHGLSGSGKSYAGISIAAIINKLKNRTLEQDDINFTIKASKDRLQFLEEIKKIIGAVQILDEQTYQGGFSSKHYEMYRSNVESTIRQWKVDFINISTELKKHNHHIILETTEEIDYQKGYSKLMLYTKIMGYEEFRPVGYVIIPYPPQEILDIYEKRKSENIRRLMKDEGENRPEDIDKKIQEVANDINFMFSDDVKEGMYWVRKHAETFSTTDQEIIMRMAKKEVMKRLKNQEEAEKTFGRMFKKKQKKQISDGWQWKWLKKTFEKRYTQKDKDGKLLLEHPQIFDTAVREIMESEVASMPINARPPKAEVEENLKKMMEETKTHDIYI